MDGEKGEATQVDIDNSLAFPPVSISFTAK